VRSDYVVKIIYMKRINSPVTFIFLVLFWFSGNTISAQNPSWVWAKSATGSEESGSIATDQSGNSFAAGKFTGSSVTFGTHTLVNEDASGLTSDLFLVKYDADGNVVWAKGAFTDMNMADGAASVTTDNTGNIYMTGSFSSDTIKFGNFPVKNKFYTKDDIFIVKFNPAGNALWARSAGGTMYDYGRSIAVDGSGNVFVTGSFQWSMNIGTYLESDDHTNGSHNDVFLAKYNSDGNFMWAVNAEGSYSDIPESVTTDDKGNVYVTGRFNSHYLTFGTHMITNFNASGTPEFIPEDIFLVKYDGNGNCLWAKSAGGNNTEAGSSVKVDLDGSIFLTGYYKSPVFKIGNSTLTNFETAGARNDLFIAKLDGSGNVIWANSSGGSGDDCAYSVAIENNNVYQAGYFSSSTITFGTVTLTLNDPSNCFIARYDKDGKASWVLTSLGDSQIKAQSISLDAAGNAFITGNFSGPVNFGTSGLSDNGIFVAKAVTGNLSEIIDTDKTSTIKTYPNPAKFSIGLETSDQSEVEIYNSSGIFIKRILTNSCKTDIDLSDLPDGIYIFKIISGGKTELKKIIKG